MSGEGPIPLRILPKTVALYGCFAGITLVGLIWQPLLIPAFFTWPYPFLLSAQRFISDPAGATSWVVALVVGLVFVVACAWAVQNVIVQKRMMSLQQWGIAILSIVLPLGLLTGVTWAIAFAAGWPVGE